MGPEPRPLNDLDGFMLAVVGDNPRKRSFYCACWNTAPAWIPYEADADGNWQKVDDYPPRLMPTLYTFADVCRVLDDVRATHTLHFGARVRIIDAATGSVCQEIAA